MRSMASSVLPARCLILEPHASNSLGESVPRPTAGSMRPLLMKSTVAISLARTAGLRRGRARTLLPNFMRLVRAAMAAMTVMDSML